MAGVSKYVCFTEAIIHKEQWKETHNIMKNQRPVSAETEAQGNSKILWKRKICLESTKFFQTYTVELQTLSKPQKTVGIVGNKTSKNAQRIFSKE